MEALLIFMVNDSIISESQYDEFLIMMESIPKSRKDLDRLLLEKLPTRPPVLCEILRNGRSRPTGGHTGGDKTERIKIKGLRQSLILNR